MEKTERDGKDGAARGGEADLSRLERFDRMQKIKWPRSRISREDYAANLRGFSTRLQKATLYLARMRPVKFVVELYVSQVCL